MTLAHAGLAVAQEIAKPTDAGNGALPVIPVEPSEPKEAAATTEENPVAQLETVTVTAEKRPRALRETAGSVAALTDHELVDSQDAEAFIKLIPGVSLNKENGDRNDPSIRGVATETRFQTTARATGIYVDDIPLSDPFIPISQPDLNPFDLQQIEVLRGPQGALFGSTALAGAFRYLTRKPVLDEFQGKVMGSLARVADGDQQPLAAAMLNLPIGGSLALRGVAVYRNDPAYIDDLHAGRKDVGGIRQRHGRVGARWQPITDLAVTATYLRQSTRQDDAAYADQRDRREHSNANGPSPMSDDFDVANLVVGYDFSAARLWSSTSTVGKAASLDLEAGRTLGVEQTGVPVYSTVDTDSRAFTQELRLTSPEGSSFEWLLGLWYLSSRQDYDQHIPNPALDLLTVRLGQSLPLSLPLPGIPGLPLPDLGAENAELAAGHFHSRGSEQAMFGNVTLKFGKRVDLTLGGRLYRTQLHSHNVSRGLLVTATSGATEQTNDDELLEKGFNPRVSAALHLTSDVTLYALLSKGFRFGGVQLMPPSSIGTGDAPSNVFKSDRLWNHELGLRTQWFHRRLSLDATLFYERWKDLQITRVDSTGLFTFVQNIGAAHTRGAELSLQLTPLRGLLVSSSAAWIQARTDEALETADGTVPPDTRLPGTPPFQIADLLAYEPDFGRWTAGVWLIHSHVGESFNNLFATERVGSYDTLDVRVHGGWKALPLRPDLMVALTNVTDRRGVAGAFAEPGTMAHDFYFITPRTFTVTLSLSF